MGIGSTVDCIQQAMLVSDIQKQSLINFLTWRHYYLTGKETSGSGVPSAVPELYMPRLPKNSSLPTNCKNCGAALRASECEYCGTTYILI